MIICQILGGLGNQMFQYAAAKKLSLSVGQQLLLDAESFATYRLHNFELTKVFSCDSKFVTSPDLKKVLSWRAIPKVRSLLSYRKLAWLSGDSYIIEPHFHYWESFHELAGNCYLQGYWQSEKYFSLHERAIRKDFKFKIPLDEKNQSIVDKMSHCNAVSLHIRRGDYVANAKTNNTHGTCSLDYYRAAIAMISAQVESPEFFVFSDDINWVKENLVVDFPCIHIDHNTGEDNYRDMQLMSLCQHNIIANSSFSWWGAWLNNHDDKIVIAPKKWFAIERNTNDLIPESWVRL